MKYSIISENEPNGEGTGWFECDPIEAEAWSVWTVEDGQCLDLIEMFETKEQAKVYLESIVK